jgi:hypothetical protein
MRALALAAVVCLGTALPVVAEEFRRITEQSEFIRLVADRDLTRLGIRLEVSPEGGIGGSAFGTGVTGAWAWRGSYFCRDLRFGRQELGLNCQAVLVNGNTVRFVADQGQGDFADFRLR